VADIRSKKNKKITFPQTGANSCNITSATEKGYFTGEL